MSNKIEKLRKEARISTDEEFTTKYPGVKRDAIQTMSDSELEKVVGGIVAKNPYITKNTGLLLR